MSSTKQKQQSDKELHAKDVVANILNRQYFKIKRLQALDKLTNEDIFGPNDFTIPPKKEGRFPVIVKLGSLLMVYLPGGKASFSLRVKFIDVVNKQTHGIFSYNSNRMPDFLFDDLVPISLSEYYGSETICIKAQTPQIASIRQCAGEIRNYLVAMSLGKQVDQNDFQNTNKKLQKLSSGLVGDAGLEPVTPAM